MRLLTDAPGKSRCRLVSMTIVAGEKCHRIPSDSDFLLDATASKLRLPHFGHLIFFPMTSPPAWHPRCGCYSRPYLSPLIFEWDIFEPKELRPVFCSLWGQGAVLCPIVRATLCVRVVNQGCCGPAESRTRSLSGCRVHRRQAV